MNAISRNWATAERPGLARLGAGLAAAGGALGLLAGIAELTAGPSIRSWVGDKSDTTRLGIATIILCAIALTAALELARRPETGAPRRFALAVAMFLPGVMCFTTVGRLAYVPGSLLAAGGILVLAGLRGRGHELAIVAERHWTAVLTAVLGCSMIVLGATALGAAGALGIAGGLLLVGLVATKGRLALRWALPLLVLAVLPFVALTWWSVVTPLIGALALALGALALNPRRS